MSTNIWHDLCAMRGMGTVGGVALEWAVRSDVGRVRAVNEDRVMAQPPLFVVADGMGGHEAGDVASTIAIECFESLAGDTPIGQREVVEAVAEANSAIVTLGRQSGSARSMGTTVAGLALVDNGSETNWLAFNVGDSRIYRVMFGEIDQVSTDHSYVQELVDARTISRDEARTHPHRNVVTRALGMELGAEPDIWLLRPVAGERFVVCSDGLSSEIDDVAILSTMLGRDPDDAAAALVAAALDAGGADNVSIVVVDVVSTPFVDDADTAPRSLTDGDPTAVVAAVVPDEVVESDESAISDAPTPDPAAPADQTSPGADPSGTAMITGIPSGLAAAALAGGSPNETEPESASIQNGPDQ